MTVIYQDTNKTIEVLQEYAEDQDGNPIQPRIEQYTYVGKPDPDPAVYVQQIVDGDPVSQRVLDKIADFLQTANQAEGFTVTSGNNTAITQKIVDEFPDVLRAIVWLAMREIRGR